VKLETARSHSDDFVRQPRRRKIRADRDGFYVGRGQLYHKDSKAHEAFIALRYNST
jgi:hypothetical protein